MRIAQNTIDDIFDSITIDNFTKLLPELKRTGSGYVCKSPFGEEKTPSFHVFNKNGNTFYKDFSSGKGGTFINLLMELHNKNYPEALKYTADENGIQIVTEGKPLTPEEIEKSQRLKHCLTKTVEQWQKQFAAIPYEHPAWVELLEHRKLTDQDVQSWELGFAPDQWQWAWDYIRESGYYTEAKELGIIIEKDAGKVFDSQRNRIIIPIHDHNANLVGFAGQALAKDDIKYLNASASDLYDKSKVLFGLHLAKAEIQVQRNAYLVEGYHDVMALHRTGAVNTVATCGTALTPDQCKLLKRFSPRVTLLRDADPAGRKAALRDFELLISHGLEVHICNLPEGVDPDDFSRMHDVKVEEKKADELVEV